MTRDPTRPPEHPLVELVYELWPALGRRFADGNDETNLGSHGYQQLRGALGSARRFVDALELLVDELEAQSRPSTDAPSNEDGNRDDDFQTITIRRSDAGLLD
jgi:hypothetical protein